MLRAGQTPHRARPNRGGSAACGGAGRLGAPELPGRSLMSARSNAPPRGMIVVFWTSVRTTEFCLQVQSLHGPSCFRDEAGGLQFCGKARLRYLYASVFGAQLGPLWVQSNLGSYSAERPPCADRCLSRVRGKAIYIL